MTNARACCAVLLVFVVLLAQGCVTVGPKPRPTPKIPPQPRDAKADIMLLNIAPPSDLDGDTVPDSFNASTHMFDERYQLPINVAGRVEFTLMARNDDTPIHNWEFVNSDLQRHLFEAQVGPVYRFRLQIPIDAEPVRERFVNIRCVLTDPEGHVTQAWHRDMPWLSVGG